MNLETDENIVATGKTEDTELYKIIQDNKFVYALTTFDRAIPYYKDGLTSVYRRILFDMYHNGVISTGKTRKSAKTVGDIIGTYHPHGDASVYNAMVTLSQPWTNNHPLIHGQGNWGNDLGDPAAAYRYTECKLSKFFSDVVEDISPNFVNYIDNYDNTTQEAEYIPFKIPMILVNGAFGIAESYQCSIPPHNIGDVVDICKKFILNPEIPNDVLVDGFLPDFPNYGIIVNKSDVERVYKYGKDTGEKVGIKVKSTLDIDRVNNKITIKDLPYGRTRKHITDIFIKKNAENHLVMSKILDLVNIKTIRDGQEHMEYEVLFDKNSNILEIANNLEKFCTTKIVNIGFMLNYDGRIKIVNIKEIVKCWYDTLKSTMLRKINFQCAQMQNRLHVLEGLLIVYDYISDIIDYIKTTSETKEGIIQYIADKYKLTNIQSKAIAEMQLYSLSRVSKDALIKNIEELRNKIIIGESELLLIDQRMIESLDDIKNKYNRPRRTLLTDTNDENESTSSIIISNGALLHSHNQYSIFDIQNIVNGKTLMNGLKSVKIGGKNVKEIIGCHNIENDIVGVIMITDDGMAKRIDPSEISATNNWIPLDIEGIISTMIPIYNDDDKIIILSDSNKIRIIPVESIKKQLVNVGKINVAQRFELDKSHVIVATESGKYHMINSKEIPELGRTATGVMVNLPDNEKVSMMQIKTMTDDSLLCSITDNEEYNYILRVDQEYIEETNRSNKPKKIIDLGDNFKLKEINKFDIRMKESKCILIGKYSSTQMSLQSLKLADLLYNPKRIPIETLGVVQYVI